MTIDKDDVEYGAKAFCFRIGDCQCEMKEQCTSWRGKKSRFAMVVIEAMVERGWKKEP